MEWAKPNYHKGANRTPINKATKCLFNPLGNGRNMPTAAGLLDAMYPSCQDSTVFKYMCHDKPPPPNLPPEADFNLGTEMETETVVESTPLLSLSEMATRKETESFLASFRKPYCKSTNFREDPEWRFLDRGKSTDPESGATVRCTDQLLSNSAHTPHAVLAVWSSRTHTPRSTGSVEQQGTTPSPTPCLPDETNSRDAPKWQTKLGSVLAVVHDDVATVQRIDRLKARLKINPSNNFMKAEFDNCVAHLSTTYSNSCGVLRTHWGFR
ncbi:uncharacterized protein LOC144927806 [Branchiostoma floridae x Branchiostoma belcheri]